MRGVAGLGGWQWMFLIEGIFSVLVGLIFLALFPKNTSNPVSLLGFRLFTEKESQILTKRILRDDPSKISAKPNISRQEMRNVVCNLAFRSIDARLTFY